MGLKWWQTADIVQSEAQTTRRTAEAALDWLKEQQRKRREQEEAEARERGEVSRQRMRDYMNSMKFASAAEEITAANRELSKLGVDWGNLIPISESTVQQQLASGRTWVDQYVRNRELEVQAQEQEKRSDVVKGLLSKGIISIDMPYEETELYVQAELNKELAEDAYASGNIDAAQRYLELQKQYEAQIAGGIAGTEESGQAITQPATPTQYATPTQPESVRRFQEEFEQAKPTLTPLTSETGISPEVAQNLTITIMPADVELQRGGYDASGNWTLNRPGLNITIIPDLNTGDFLVYSPEGEKVGKVNIDKETLEFDDPLYPRRAMVMSDKDEAYLENIGIFEPPPSGAKAAYINITNWLNTPKQIGDTTIPAPGTIMGIVGLVGSLVMGGIQAYPALKTLFQGGVPGQVITSIYKKVAIPKAQLPKVPTSITTIQGIKEFKAFQNTAVYKDLLKWAADKGVSPTVASKSFNTMQNQLFNAYQYYLAGDATKAQQIIDQLRFASGGLPGAVSPARALTPYTGVATPAPPSAPVASPVTPTPAQAAPITGAITTPPVSGIPTMITGQMETSLMGLGYTAQQIAGMTPQQAQAILSKTEVTGGIIPTEGVKEPWEMTQQEFIEHEIKAGYGQSYSNKQSAIADLKAVHEDSIKMFLREGKPVPAEVLKDYPELARVTPEVAPGMVTGEQAGMMGVPQKVVTQKGIGKPVSESMEDYARLEQMRAEAGPDIIPSIETRIAEINKQLEIKGLRGKTNLQQELATLIAQRDVAGESPEGIRQLVKEVENEMGLREMPYRGYGGKSKIDLLRHPELRRTLKGYSGNQLEEMLRVYREALGEPTKAITPRQATEDLRRARQTVMEAGRVKFPTFINPQDSMRAALRDAGVQLPPEQVKKGLFTALGLSPMRVVSRSDPSAAKITEMGRRAFAEYEDAMLDGADRAKEAFKGLTLPELEKLVELQESGTLTPEFIKGLSPKYQKAINDGFRWFNKEIKKIAEDEFKIDTSKWRFTEENYFHHLFLGDQMLKVGDGTKAIGKLSDLYPKVEELISQGVPPVDISIVPKFSQGDVPTTLLSRKGFWSFISRLSKTLEVSGDDLLTEMRGVAGIKPRPKFVGAFEPRLADLQGYLKDPKRVYTILWDRVQRKRYLQPFTKEATELISKIKTPWLRKEMEDYIQSVGGKYIEPTYLMGINLSKVAAHIVKMQSKLKLGYRLSTAMLNRLQAFQMAYQELGNYYFIGEAKRFTPEGRETLAKMNLQTQRPKYTTGGYEERGAGRVKPWHPLALFSRTEKEVREATGLGTYYMGIRKLEMSEADAIAFAENMNDVTMLRYDVSDLPKVFRNPIGRMAFQFRPFVIGYVSNAFDVIRGKPLAGLEQYESLMYSQPGQKAKRAARFFGSNFVVGGLKTISRLFTPFGIGFITYLAIKHPKLFQGMFSYAGIDISERAGASPFEVIPNDIWDLLGLVAGDVQRIYKAVKKYDDSEDPQDLIEVMRIAPEAWSIYRAFAEEEGIEPTSYEKLLIALGFEPSRLSDIRSGMHYIHYTTPEMRTTANWLPTEKALQNIVYYVQNYPKMVRARNETDKQYADRIDHETKRRDICLEILDRSDVTPDKYGYYLLMRSRRLS